MLKLGPGRWCHGLQERRGRRGQRPRKDQITPPPYVGSKVKSTHMKRKEEKSVESVTGGASLHTRAAGRAEDETSQL